jgi:hypothetical protein
MATQLERAQVLKARRAEFTARLFEDDDGNGDNPAPGQDGLLMDDDALMDDMMMMEDDDGEHAMMEDEDAEADRMFDALEEEDAEAAAAEAAGRSRAWARGRVLLEVGQGSCLLLF